MRAGGEITPERTSVGAAWCRTVHGRVRSARSAFQLNSQVYPQRSNPLSCTDPARSAQNGHRDCQKWGNLLACRVARRQGVGEFSHIARCIIGISPETNARRPNFELFRDVFRFSKPSPSPPSSWLHAACTRRLHGRHVPSRARGCATFDTKRRFKCRLAQKRERI